MEAGKRFGSYVEDAAGSLETIDDQAIGSQLTSDVWEIPWFTPKVSDCGMPSPGAAAEPLSVDGNHHIGFAAA